MKTVNLTELLYISEYVITAAILFLSAVKKGATDIKKEIPRTVFLRRLILTGKIGRASCRERV